MSEKILKVKIIKPNGLLIETDATMIEFTSTEGDMGIYPEHIPTTVILSPTVVTIHQNEENLYVMVSGGFAEILPDKVTIMAEDALLSNEIDIDRAQRAKDRAQNRLKEKREDLDETRAILSLKRAEARIKVSLISK